MSHVLCGIVQFFIVEAVHHFLGHTSRIFVSGPRPRPLPDRDVPVGDHAEAIVLATGRAPMSSSAINSQLHECSVRRSGRHRPSLLRELHGELLSCSNSFDNASGNACSAAVSAAFETIRWDGRTTD